MEKVWHGADFSLCRKIKVRMIANFSAILFVKLKLLWIFEAKSCSDILPMTIICQNRSFLLTLALKHKDTCDYTTFVFFETEGRQASGKVQEVVDHLAGSLSRRKEMSQSVIKPPISSLRYGYLSTIIQYLGPSRTMWLHYWFQPNWNSFPCWSKLWHPIDSQWGHFWE
jgi:hypothetical protein